MNRSATFTFSEVADTKSYKKMLPTGAGETQNPPTDIPFYVSKAFLEELFGKTLNRLTITFEAEED